ncbi:MAG: hypothetical protein K2P98_01035 [Neisseriaceae bacterium]|nr:hypothetical protein [Neisseriaceae bacterium]
MDAMFITAALASVEKFINSALAYDPATRIALQKLAPQVLAVKITLPAIMLYIAPTAEGVRVLGHFEGDVTTQVQGTASALIALLNSDSINLKDSGVEVIGSSIFLADLQHILKKLDLDWEEMLSTLLGDVLGHQGAELIRSKLGWAKNRANNITRLTSEFLTEELHVLPSKAEINFFNQQVDELRLDVDRISARINQLAQHTQP